MKVRYYKFIRPISLGWDMDEHVWNQRFSTIASILNLHLHPTPSKKNSGTFDDQNSVSLISMPRSSHWPIHLVLRIWLFLSWDIALEFLFLYLVNTKNFAKKEIKKYIDWVNVRHFKCWSQSRFDSILILLRDRGQSKHRDQDQDLASSEPFKTHNLLERKLIPHEIWWATKSR